MKREGGVMDLYEAAKAFSIRAHMNGLKWESIEDLRKAIADYEEDGRYNLKDARQRTGEG